MPGRLLYVPTLNQVFALPGRDSAMLLAQYERTRMDHLLEGIRRRPERSPARPSNDDSRWHSIGRRAPV